MNRKQVTGKQVIAQMNVTIDDERYTLNEFIQVSREREGYDIRFGARILDISENEYIELEKGNYIITETMLNILINNYKMPRKIKRLLQNPDKPIHAQRITELRVKAQRTQKETAELLGIPQTTYAGYETGRNEPDLTTLIKIADLYDADLNYIAGRYNKWTTKKHPLKQRMPIVSMHVC